MTTLTIKSDERDAMLVELQARIYDEINAMPTAKAGSQWHLDRIEVLKDIARQLYGE